MTGLITITEEQKQALNAAAIACNLLNVDGTVNAPGCPLTDAQIIDALAALSALACHAGMVDASLAMTHLSILIAMRMEKSAYIALSPLSQQAYTAALKMRAEAEAKNVN